MSMVVIFINAGFAIINQMGVFGDEIATRSTIFYNPLIQMFLNPIVVTAFSGLLVAATAIVLNTRVITDKGVAYGTFTALYFSSVFLTGMTIFANYDRFFPGVEIFYTIYVLACTVIFIIALVQMPTGGQKSHV